MGKKAAQRERARIERHKATVRHVMSDERGREFVHGLLERAGVYRSVLPDRVLAGWTASEATLFNTGAQEFGYALREEILAAAPSEYHALEQEAIRRRMNERIEAEQSDKGDESEEEHGDGG